MSTSRLVDRKKRGDIQSRSESVNNSVFDTRRRASPPALTGPESTRIRDGTELREIDRALVGGDRDVRKRTLLRVGLAPRIDRVPRAQQIDMDVSDRPARLVLEDTAIRHVVRGGGAGDHCRPTYGVESPGARRVVRRCGLGGDR